MTTTHPLITTFGTEATVLVWDAMPSGPDRARPMMTAPGPWHRGSLEARTDLARIARTEYLESVR